MCGAYPARGCTYTTTVRCDTRQFVTQLCRVRTRKQRLKEDYQHGARANRPRWQLGQIVRNACIWPTRGVIDLHCAAAVMQQQLLAMGVAVC
jgi:hypothetical protein